MPNNKQLTVIYDFKSSPITLDCVGYLCFATAYAKVTGYSGCQIQLIADGFRNLTPREKSYDVDIRIWRIYNLTLQVIQLIPYITGIKVDFNSPESISTDTFPQKYNVKTNIAIPYHQGNIVKAWHDRKIDPRILRPSKQAIKYSWNIIEPKQEFFTITLRTAAYDQERDIDLEIWHEFYRFLRQLGKRVLVIPDQDDILNKAKYKNYGWNPIIAAAFSMDLRAALYSRAKHNFIANGGFTQLLIYSKSRFSFLSVTVPGSPVASNDYYRSQGIPVGGK
jgi:hypothetical protein